MKGPNQEESRLWEGIVAILADSHGIVRSKDSVRCFGAGLRGRQITTSRLCHLFETGACLESTWKMSSEWPWTCIADGWERKGKTVQ